ncbi:Hypothetical protein SRAE_1000026300 [Strongyloides ratti]|uniref:Uncharacterized protein n=1 Tax=Strongyloides ratti TaxID=34506 RepID=A0A090L1J1_STRRB|nr:Hypothetical protein SRAE_1000026300 [Strongyloides ratti]CEF61987.1 Hypothetical protein SRAE_1000026300 [Strongyloides ratti]
MNKLNLFFFHIIFSIYKCILSNYKSNEFPNWNVSHYRTCYFCTNYKSIDGLTFHSCYNKASFCKGNICYMRKHTTRTHNLFSAGCLNATNEEMERVGNRKNTMAQAEDSVELFSEHTFLCQLIQGLITCLCAKGDNCNDGKLNASNHVRLDKELYAHFDFNEKAYIRKLMLEKVLRDAEARNNTLDITSVSEITMFTGDPFVGRLIAEPSWSQATLSSSSFTIRSYSTTMIACIFSFILLNIN